MRDTVEMIVKALMDDASAVDVREVEHAGSILIEVRVAETDMGKLIGRQGRTVRALRSIVQAASVKKGRRFLLEIVE
ncbi:MAG: KH domain-containing protein [Acidobacteria bacterium]|nr:KH domain-containing protein [Acidobacteriota bacterium]